MLQMLTRGGCDGVLGDSEERPRFRREDLDEAFAELPHSRSFGGPGPGRSGYSPIGHLRARGTASGAEIRDAHAPTCIDFKHGKATRVLTYLDPAEALEAAGLSE